MRVAVGDCVLLAFGLPDQRFVHLAEVRSIDAAGAWVRFPRNAENTWLATPVLTVAFRRIIRKRTAR